MSEFPQRVRAEYQLQTVPLAIREYVPSFTRDEALHAERKANVGTHATVLSMQSEGTRIGLQTLDDLRDAPESQRVWAQLFGGSLLGSAYHMYQWNGTRLTHRKLILPKLATAEGEFADPGRFYLETQGRLTEAATVTDRVATDERQRGRISREAYQRLARQIGSVGASVAVLPTRYFSEADSPVEVQQVAYETVDDAWRKVISMYASGETEKLASVAQLADQDSPLRRYIRDPKSGVPDEVSEAVEAATS